MDRRALSLGVLLALAAVCVVDAATSQNKRPFGDDDNAFGIKAAAVRSSALMSKPKMLRGGFHDFRFQQQPSASSSSQLLPSIAFITLGDWACAPDKLGNPSKNQARVAAGMKKFDPDFVIAMGDNFYERGIESVDDPRWKNLFEDLYDTPTLNKRWMVIVGNHDYYAKAGIEPQIKYTEKSKKWYLKSRYYTTTIKLDSDTAVDFFMLDTDAILRKGDQGQVAWLENALKQSKAAWAVVIGHHCVHSAGDHGDEPALQDTIRPLLKKYNVDIYVSGHDHVQQVLEEKLPDRTMTYIVNGSGCKVGTLPAQFASKDLTYGVEELGFSYHEINRDVYTIGMIGPDGQKNKVLQLKRRRFLTPNQSQ